MKRIPKWIYVPGALIIIVLVIFGIRKLAGKESQSPQKGIPQAKERPQAKVDAFVVQPSLLVDEISVTGSLLAFEEVDLKSEVAGRVVELNLPEGNFVKKGTLLIRLYEEDLQANLKKLQVQLEIQEKIYQRQAELLKVNGIPQNDYELTGLQLNSLRAEIEVQKVLIRKTQVLAPFDGVIGLRNISIGAQVAPTTLLATIRREDKLKLDFSVPEKYSAEIHPDMKINFTLSKSDKKYEGAVMATEQGIDALNRNLKVRAVVDNTADHLLPGTYANVVLRLHENKNALMIPTGAIIPEEQLKRVITAKNGKAHFILIKTGTRRESRIEVTEGLQPGDTVITTGLLFLKEGVKLGYSSVRVDSL